MKIVKVAIFFLLLISFFWQTGKVLADEVPDTRLTDPLSTPGRTRWRCALDSSGERTVRENPFTSGKPERRPCPVYEGQQSTCAEVSSKETGKGVICEYTPPGSTPPPDDQTGAQIDGMSWNVRPIGGTLIDGRMPKVEITFLGLDKSDNLYLYPNSNQDLARGGSLTEVYSGDGIIKTEVCGNGDNSLKGDKIGKKKACKTDGSDYFHEGNIYRLGLYSNQNGDGRLMVAEFYVRHSYPWVRVAFEKPKGPTAIGVKLWGKRPGGPDKNNYQVVIEGIDNNLKVEECPAPIKDGGLTYPAGLQTANVDSAGAPGTIQENMAPLNYSVFPPGRYVVKINDRVHEGGFLGTGIGYKCNGGFTYMHIPLKIVATQSECKATDKSKCGNIVGKIEFDPNESDAAEEFDLFAGARAVCAEGGYDFKNNTCTKVNTAIDFLIGGPISVTPEGFVGSIFTVVLTLAAFGAIIIIIYSGYMLITSAGNKERIAAARETITSAVVGLLFIIFSLVILEILGVDILRIPGLTR